MSSIENQIKAIEQKKAKLDKLRPLSKESVKNINDWIDVELTYNSNAIEGNTLTKQETAIVIEKGLTVGGKSLKEHLEAINHKIALDFIKNLSNKKYNEINLQDILEIHRLILKRIDENNGGKLRKIGVRISGSDIKLPDAIKVPEILENLIKEIRNNSKNPLVLAADAHYKLVAIHPFFDGNGRTARLLMNLILIQNGYPPTIIKNSNRVKYINAIAEADKGNLTKFYKFILDATEETLDAYLEIAN